MAPLKGYLNRRLTIGQTIGVLVVVCLLGGLGYGGYQLIAAKILETRVNAAMPTICAEARKQRDAIVNAIEGYKAQFGVYPPDHVVSRDPLLVDPVTNTLVYELSGVIIDPRNGNVQVAGLEPAGLAYVTNFFQCKPFLNCSENPQRLKTFLRKEDAICRQFHDDPDVFGLAFNITSGAVASEVVWELDLESWRYVSTSPTNNPGKFDLWTDIRYRGRTIRIGNWKEGE
jgi:hypothetical protein